MKKINDEANQYYNNAGEDDPFTHSSVHGAKIDLIPGGILNQKHYSGYR
jgi:hypothetical protein